MESIKAIKAANLDYKRISNSANEASNNTFLDENNILKTAWGDENGEVEFVPMDNGTYLIEQDGIGMGFTDEEGYKTAVGDNNSEEPEILELDDETKKTNDSYNDKTTNENTYTDETEKDIIKDTVEEIDKMVKNVENKHDYENNKIENIEEQKNANDLKKDLNSPILQTGNSSFNNDIKQILEERKNNRNIENEEIKQEKTAIGDLKKEYYDGINNNNYNIDNISKTVLGAAKKIVDNVINENKKNIDKIAAIQKENYYKYPDYQERINHSIEDYNQCDGKIADIDFFGNGSDFRSIGCGVSSIMYIYSILNNDYDFDPIEFTNDAINQGYFSPSGSTSTMLLNNDESNILKTKWGLNATEVESNADSIISALEDGKKVIFNLNINDGFYATGAGHYVVLDHYNKDTNQIFIFDPAARPGFRSTERMGYQDVDYLKEVMFNIPNNPPIAVESSKEKGSTK